MSAYVSRVGGLPAQKDSAEARVLYRCHANQDEEREPPPHRTDPPDMKDLRVPIRVNRDQGEPFGYAGVHLRFRVLMGRALGAHLVQLSTSNDSRNDHQASLSAASSAESSAPASTG
jgi:hypothetical protein